MVDRQPQDLPGEACPFHPVWPEPGQGKVGHTRASEGGACVIPPDIPPSSPTVSGSGLVMTQQFKTWVVCQLCGRAAPREDAEGWLDQPHRDRIGVRVVRCPAHWSEWALRHTRAGRTKENRQRMREALQMEVPPIPAHASPFPMTDREQ